MCVGAPTGAGALDDVVPVGVKLRIAGDLGSAAVTPSGVHQHPS